MNSLEGAVTMLVLMRKTGEEILIPTLGVKVKVVSTKGNRTRIGIEAPEDLPIRREELSSDPMKSPAETIAHPR